MSTTTIRLPEHLKTRIAQAAEHAGKSSHAFILEAITEKTDLQEKQSDFNATADRRYARIVKSGKTVPWDETARYLEQRLTREPAGRPKARKLAP